MSTLRGIPDFGTFLLFQRYRNVTFNVIVTLCIYRSKVTFFKTKFMAMQRDRERMRSAYLAFCTTGNSLFSPFLNFIV